jgi:hypothetical protein
MPGPARPASSRLIPRGSARFRAPGGLGTHGGVDTGRQCGLFRADGRCMA